jgi:hypothetical protein
LHEWKLRTDDAASRLLDIVLDDVRYGAVLYDVRYGAVSA